MNRFLTCLCLALLLAAGFVGCDSKTATDTSLPAGNVSDPEFQAASEAVAFTDQTDHDMLDDLYDVVGNIDHANPAPGRRVFARYATAAADSFLATYNSTTNYWTIYFAYTNPIDSSSWVYRDSLQFRHNGTPQQWPDTTINEIRAGKLLDVIFRSVGPATQIPQRNPNLNRLAASGTLSASRELVITGEIPQEGDVVVNGSGATTISAQNVGHDSCDWNVSLASTITNLQVNIAAAKLDGCPTGGTIHHQGTIAVTCTGANSGTYNDTWTQNITYTPDGLTVEAQNSRASWTWSGSCNERPGDDHLQEGDSNDRDLQAFERGFGRVFDVSGSMVKFVFDATFFIAAQNPGQASVPRGLVTSRLSADSVSVVYNAETKYWAVYLNATDSQKMENAVVYDSIQFRNGDMAVKWPDSLLTTEIRSGMGATVNLLSTGVTVASNAGSIHGTHHWVFKSADGPIWTGDIIADGPVRFNGEFSAAADSGSCAYNFEIRGGYGRVRFDPVVLAENGCPTDGVIEFGGDFGLNCDGPRGTLSLTDKWAARYAFNEDGSANWHFENTRNFWDGVNQCHPNTTAVSSRKVISAR